VALHARRVRLIYVSNNAASMSLAYWSGSP